MPRGIQHSAVLSPDVPRAVVLDDKREFQRKAGYLGHVPRFASCRSGASGSEKEALKLHERVGNAKSRTLFQSYYPFAAMPVREDPSGSLVHKEHQPNRAGKFSRWSMREVPTESHNHPHQPPKRPLPSRHIVGFSGHRSGAQFIAGETFTQEEVMRCPGSPQARGSGYEPNKAWAKGRMLTWVGGRDTEEDTSRDAGLAPRLAGLPSLLRASRRPQSAPASRSRSEAKTPHSRHLQYPIQRGPSRVRVGGHDVFLVN